MIETLFSQLTHWHWLILALVLFGSEMIGAGGMLLGAMLAALLLSAVNYFTPLAWQYQLILFSLMAIVFSLSYWKFFKKFNQQSDRPELNNRVAQLIGHRMTLSTAIDFQGRVQIGDTFWKVKSDTSLAPGTQVEVTDAKVDTLFISEIK